MSLSYRKGLEGVIATETKISCVDGEKGYFIYRGYWAKDLAIQYTFEEVAYFIWHGYFPNETELQSFKQKLNEYRQIPQYVKEVINLLPENMHLMDVLRTAISAVGNDSFQWPPKIEDAIRLTAITPTIIAYWHRKKNELPLIEPNDNFDHVSNFLYMLTGKRPTYAHCKALSSYMILTMEHGMNASTFSSRVVCSTESDMVSAIVAAIGAMKGPLHGGAPSGVLRMLDEIGTPEEIEPYIVNKLEKGEKLMGFGHRIYKTTDPRAETLKEVAKGLAGEEKWFDLAVQLEEKAIELLNRYKPGRKLYANVEFYAAAILKGISLPKSLFTPTFTASRMVGWTAHILEQASDNRIFRPQSLYVGKMPKM
ncbi:citrate synthase/methylcitrate synthase [Fervidibacillus albus]|uniref:Citrate synthase n=1 Tax=Fervidibacillus albus TaxID=2980026 RepID=A0A9E8LWS1_9BACI|nr:citrate synthase/methylcitrate synthase [Fervidibacillus albus]WAA11138.1 citrate synthase/methylcitrate synthase [Fervidibacillus albus]